MLLPLLRSTRRAVPRPLLQACRIQAMSTGHNVPGTFDYEEAPLPTLVLEEEVTKLPPGHPKTYSEEVWSNPNMLLPERQELWYDDGTAEPEFFAGEKGRPNYDVDMKTAAFELAMAFTVVLGGGYSLALLLDDRHRHVVPWKETLPFDLRREYGLKEEG